MIGKKLQPVDSFSSLERQIRRHDDLIILICGCAIWRRRSAFIRACCQSLVLRSIRAENSGASGRHRARGRWNFLALPRRRNISRNDNRIAFWAESREEVDRLAEVVQAGRRPESGGSRRFGGNIRPVITLYFLKTRAGTSSRSAADTVSSLEIAFASARRIGMRDEATIPNMLRPQRRVRYLKMIAVFKSAGSDPAQHRDFASLSTQPDALAGCHLPLGGWRTDGGAQPGDALPPEPTPGCSHGRAASGDGIGRALLCARALC